MKKILLFLSIFISVNAFSQNSRNYIQPLDQEGFVVDSILSMRGDYIIYLRAGTEFDIEKSKVLYVEHAAIGRIDITTSTNTQNSIQSSVKNPLPVPEPEFNGDGYILNLDNNTFIKMERAVGQVKTKEQFWGPEKKLYIKPARSSVRIKQGMINVIIRVPDINEDPYSFIKLSRFSVSQTRKLSLARQNDFTGKVTYGGYNDQELHFNCKKYGTSSFLLTFAINSPGEYCISISNPNKIDAKQSVSCFGVD